MTALPVLPSDVPPTAELSDSARRAIARDLANAVEGEVRFGFHDRMLYATDASLYQVEPIGVVIPASTEDAARAVRFCAERGLPILPRGGGTSLAGQCTNRAVVIDFSPNCRAVLELDVEARRCRVEPGITIDDLNDHLAATGLFFAPDPATSRHANIGGCIGNNAAGARSIRYGRTSESLLGVDACLADGTRVRLERGSAGRDPRVAELTSRVCGVVAGHRGLIRERFPKTIRRNAGYSLDLILNQMEGVDGFGADVARGTGERGDVSRGVSRGTSTTFARANPSGPARDGIDFAGLFDQINLASLVCGSEGTLAVTLGAVLKLYKRPVARGLAVIAFDTLDEAIEAVVPILATRPTAVELLDDMVIGLARANTEYRRYVELLPAPPSGVLKAALYVEYSAEGSADELRAGFESLKKVLPGVPASAIQNYTDAAAMLSAWKLRKAGEPLLHGVPGARKPVTFVEDNAVPVENLARFVREFRKMVDGYGTRAAYWAHASVGVLHIRPLIDLHDEGDRELMRKIGVEGAELARSMGGVMSGEHGDGRVRGPLLERFYGPEVMEAFKEVKRIFDPSNLLNPGNEVDLDGRNPRPVESMTQSLRVDLGRNSSALPGGKREEESVGSEAHQGLKPLATVVRPSGEEKSLSRTEQTSEGGHGGGHGTGHALDGVDTFFDYEDQHGFGSAVEMCNGAGICRKKQGGTMCPSYMGTLDERHSTRGRGNALRLAITGQVEGLRGRRGGGGTVASFVDPGRAGVDVDERGQEPPPASSPHSGADSLPPPPVGEDARSIAADVQPVWDDRETIETLNLCLSCKACKTECPSNVDIARLKAEYTGQRYRSKGAPIAARIMGEIRLLNRLGAMMPGVANAVSRVGLVRLVMNAVLGLDARRSLPPFARSLKREWGREVPGVERRDEKTPHRPRGLGHLSPSQSRRGEEGPRVVLFGDCFTMYNEPGIGMATKRVMEALGYRVELADAGCCARAKISMGLLSEAVEEADATLERLRSVIEDEGVVAVLVAEPSCLSAFKDDWLSLKLRTPMALRKKLAAKAFLPEDFVERKWEEHPRRIEFRVSGEARTSTSPRRLGEVDGTVGKAILHGHCHQKALWGAESSAKLMRRIFGDGLRVLDSGCCGMAGSFGYTKDRYNLSMKIGEQVVLPAARKAAEEGVVVIAPGTSCRHQIHDGAGARAMHPMEVVAERMGLG